VWAHLESRLIRINRGVASRFSVRCKNPFEKCNGEDLLCAFNVAPGRKCVRELTPRRGVHYGKQSSIGHGRIHALRDKSMCIHTSRGRIRAAAFVTADFFDKFSLTHIVPARNVSAWIIALLLILDYKQLVLTQFRFFSLKTSKYSPFTRAFGIHFTELSRLIFIRINLNFQCSVSFFYLYQTYFIHQNSRNYSNCFTVFRNISIRDVFLQSHLIEHFSSIKIT